MLKKFWKEGGISFMKFLFCIDKCLKYIKSLQKLIICHNRKEKTFLKTHREALI